jgi:kinesin family protein C1
MLQYFDKTISVNEEKVRGVTTSLARSKSQFKHDFKKRCEKYDDAVKGLTTMLVTLIAETKQVKTLCVGHENDTDSRLRENSLQLQEMTQTNAMMVSNENKIKKEIAALKERAAEQEASYEQMKQDAEPFRAKVRDLEQRLSEAVAKLSSEQALGRSHEAKCARLEQELAGAGREVSEAKSLVLEEVKKAQQQHEKKLAKLGEEHSAREKSLKEGFDDAKAALMLEKSRVDSELEKARAAMAHKDGNLESLMASQNDLQKQMAEERSSLRAEISAANEKVEALEAERLQTTSDFAAKREESVGLQKELVQAKESISLLSEKMVEKEAELLQAREMTAVVEKERELRLQAERRENAEREERVATSAQLMATQNDCSTKIMAAKKKCTEAIATMDAAYKKLGAELDASKQANSAQADTIMGLENEATELRSQVENACANHETVEKLGKVSGELEVLKRRMRETSDSKQLELARAMTQIEELEEKLKAGDGIRRKLHNVIQELRGNVRVFARVRPFLPNDGVDMSGGASPDATIIPRSDNTSLRIMKGQSEESRGEDHSFSFDRVFGPSSSQENVFTEVSEFVQSALDGYNVCLFSYGQTGSGKTHTMQGAGCGALRGIIPRAMEQVGMYKLELEKKGWEYEMEVSFIEIYNETIRDLLRSTASDDVKHDIKKDANGNTSVTDVTMERVDPNDTEQISLIMDIAARHRSVGQTAMNERSSRSHSVFCLHLKASNKEQGIILKGALNLVDLAGSERLDRSGAQGERMRETVAINKSLSSLTDVFVAIGNKQSHIPFRNSKLTYLLQPALSGDGKTLMMVNLSPTEASFGESVCSLRFASQVNKCELGKAKKQTQSITDTAPTAAVGAVKPGASRLGGAAVTKKRALGGGR